MKKLLFIALVSMMFSNNIYAKKAKSSGSKGTLSSKSAVAPQKKTDAPNQAPAAQAPATNSNAAAAPAASAPAQNPSLLQSVMPALVGGAVGSYVGSKLADDGTTEKAVAEKAEKKDEHPLIAK